MKPNPKDASDLKSKSLMGSMAHSEPQDEATGGGGHIHIRIDSLKLTGDGK